MSIGVDLDRLREEAARHGSWAYLLTTNDDARPHAVAVTIAWDDDCVVVEGGRRTSGNAAARPNVSLLWPPHEVGGYHLVVDADATVDDGAVRLHPTRATLHRPAPADAPPSATGCESDCVRLDS
jgi:hypothetical protein